MISSLLIAMMFSSGLPSQTQQYKDVIFSCPVGNYTLPRYCDSNEEQASLSFVRQCFDNICYVLLEGESTYFGSGQMIVKSNDICSIEPNNGHSNSSVCVPAPVKPANDCWYGLYDLFSVCPSDEVQATLSYVRRCDDDICDMLSEDVSACFGDGLMIVKNDDLCSIKPDNGHCDYSVCVPATPVKPVYYCPVGNYTLDKTCDSDKEHKEQANVSFVHQCYDDICDMLLEGEMTCFGDDQTIVKSNDSCSIEPAPRDRYCKSSVCVPETRAKPAADCWGVGSFDLFRVCDSKEAQAKVSFVRQCHDRICEWLLEGESACFRDGHMIVKSHGVCSIEPDNGHCLTSVCLPVKPTYYCPFGNYTLDPGVCDFDEAQANVSFVRQCNDDICDRLLEGESACFGDGQMIVKSHGVCSIKPDNGHCGRSVCVPATPVVSSCPFGHYTLPRVCDSDEAQANISFVRRCSDNICDMLFEDESACFGDHQMMVKSNGACYVEPDNGHCGLSVCVPATPVLSKKNPQQVLVTREEA